MYSRLETDAEPIFLPDEWTQNVVGILNSLYSDKFIDKDLAVEVYGLTYPEEVVLIVSLLNSNDDTAAAITYMASAPLTDKKDPTSILDTLVDSAGGFLDHILDSSEEVEYLALWTEARAKDLDFHYMITRENVALSLEATKLLREH